MNTLHQSIRLYTIALTNAAGRNFSDPIGALYIAFRARERFHRLMHLTSESRITAAVKEARRADRLLGRANGGNPAAIQKVLEHSYGQRGKLKHVLSQVCQRIIVSDDGDLDCC